MRNVRSKIWIYVMILILHNLILMNCDVVEINSFTSVDHELPADLHFMDLDIGLNEACMLFVG